jgi:hypothetical protein
VQIGTENKKKVMWAGGLGALALILVAYEFFGSSSAPVTAAQPAPGVTNARAGGVRRTRNGKDKEVTEPRLDPTLDLRLLAETENTKYTGNGRNIFVAQQEVIEKPVAPVKIPTDTGSLTPPPPPPPPPPPQIPLKFFGFANKPGEPKKAFLSSTDGDVFIAIEGEIVDRRYKVIHIGPMSVEIEDVLYNNRQNIPLTQGPQG